MTPKEKAEELYYKYFKMITIESPIDRVSSIPYVKKCVRILIGEVVYSIDWKDFETSNKTFKYWWEVLQEIEAL